MGHRCCSKQKVKRGLWSPEEDEKLIKHITTHGHGSWSSVPKLAGLDRCGKSCRLRWINYLRPDLKRGSFSAQEERIIIDVHRILGNRWAQIAKHLPGRTDNEVKNFWNSCVKKKLIAQGLDPNTHNLLPSHKTINNHYNGCNLSHPKPTSVFSVNSQMEDACMDMNTPFSTLLSLLPSDPSTHFPHDSQNIPIYEHQSPHFVWTIQEQNPNAFMDSSMGTSTVPISISPPTNPSGFGILEDNCLWSNPSSQLQRIEVSRQDEIMLQPEQQAVKNPQHEKASEVQMENAHILNMDASFRSSNFGFDFLESPGILSCGMHYNTSPVDEFAWDC